MTAPLSDAKDVPANPRMESVHDVPISVDPPKKAPHGGKRPGAGRRPNVSPVPQGPPQDGAPVPPFAGGPPGATGEPAKRATPPKSKADPRKVARIVQGMIDGGMVALAKWRYDQMAIEDEKGGVKPLWELAKASDDDAKEIQEAIVDFMQAYAFTLTPGQQLIMAIGAAYVPSAIALEQARSALLAMKENAK